MKLNDLGQKLGKHFNFSKKEPSLEDLQKQLSSLEEQQSCVTEWIKPVDVGYGKISLGDKTWKLLGGGFAKNIRLSPDGTVAAAVDKNPLTYFQKADAPSKKQLWVNGKRWKGEVNPDSIKVGADGTVAALIDDKLVVNNEVFSKESGFKPESITVGSDGTVGAVIRDGLLLTEEGVCEWDSVDLNSIQINNGKVYAMAKESERWYMYGARMKQSVSNVADGTSFSVGYDGTKAIIAQDERDHYLQVNEQGFNFPLDDYKPESLYVFNRNNIFLIKNDGTWMRFDFDNPYDGLRPCNFGMSGGEKILSVNRTVILTEEASGQKRLFIKGNVDMPNFEPWKEGERQHMKECDLKFINSDTLQVSYTPQHDEYPKLARIKIFCDSGEQRKKVIQATKAKIASMEEAKKVASLFGQESTLQGGDQSPEELDQLDPQNQKIQQKILKKLQKQINKAASTEDIQELRMALEQERLAMVSKVGTKLANELVGLATQAIASKEEDIQVAKIYENVDDIRGQLDNISNLDGITSAQSELTQMAETLKKVSLDKRKPKKDKEIGKLQDKLAKKMKDYLKVDNEQLFEDLGERKGKILAKIRTIETSEDLQAFQEEDPDYNGLLELLKSDSVARRIPRDHELSEAHIRADIVSALKSRAGVISQKEAQKKVQARQELEKRMQQINDAIDFMLTGIESVQNLEERVLSRKKSYQRIIADIEALPPRAQERKKLYLKDRIRARKREVNQEFLKFKGELSFLQNDPDLYFEDARVKTRRVNWKLEPEIQGDQVFLSFRDNGKRKITPSDRHILESDFAYQVSQENYSKLLVAYKKYLQKTPKELIALRKELQEEDSKISDIEKKAIYLASVYKKLGVFNGHRERNVPTLNEHYVYTDRVKDDLKKAALFLKMQLKSGKGMLIFEGDTGTGKDFLLDILLAETNRELFAFDCSKWTEISDATYSFEFDGKTIKVPSAVVQALETPGACLYFNEYNTLSEDMVKFFNALLSHRRTITTSDGKTIKADPSVIITGSMNARKGYKGVRQLSPDAKGRVDYVTVDYPPAKMSMADLSRQKDDRNLTVRDIAKDILHLEGLNNVGSNVGKAEMIAKSILELIMLSKPETQEEKEILKMEVIGAIDGNRGGEGNLYSSEEAMMVYRNVDVLRDLTQSEFQDLWNVVINQQEAKLIKTQEIQGDLSVFNKAETALLSILIFVKAANIARLKFSQSQSGESDEIIDFIMSTREVDRCATVLDLVV